jgi:transcriptional regulator with XRE-family HTH domain
MLKPQHSTSSLFSIIGRNIENERRQQKLSKQALAEKAGCSRATVFNIEKGIQRPSLTLIYRIAKAFSCSYLDLLPAEKDIEKKISSDIDDVTNKENIFNQIRDNI